MRNSRTEKVWGVDFTQPLPPVKKDLPPWCIVEGSRVGDLVCVNVRSFTRYVTIDTTAF